MWRDIGITVDSALPKVLHSHAGTRRTNVGRALVHTALWTRPPTVHGFHLSDMWAWLRYGPAIDGSADLRLRPAWKSIDPHQKTILSDELGVGFTTQLLFETVGPCVFVDTLFLVNTLAPGHYSLTSSKKTGRKKSPDYVAFCVRPRRRRIVLECKGTQASHRALLKAIGNGTSQKGNIKGPGLWASISAGLFIPQSNSSEDARIHLADPEWAGLEGLLQEYPWHRIIKAGIQVALAKHLALAGMSVTADYLASTPQSELASVPDSVRSDINEWMSLHPDHHSWKTVAAVNPGRSNETRFQVRIDKSAAHVLTNESDGRQWVDWFMNKFYSTEGAGTADMTDGDVATPLGFAFAIAGPSAI